MEKLFSVINAEQIYFSYAKLLSNTRSTLYGVYFYVHGSGPAILCDSSLEKPENRRLHNCVLAEEIGHYFTAPQSNIFKMYGSCNLDYLHQLQRSRDEIKALKWAVNYLIPDEQFNKAILDGCQSVHELAEFFDVTEWFVYRKLGAIKIKA